VNRRHWVAAGVAGAAAALGAGWSAWRRHGQAQASAGLWQMRFEQPGGGELVMAELRGRPLVLNFWASWCAPCVREMPELDRFHREFSPAGWSVVGLAIDGPTPVREFLQRQPVSFPIGLAGLSGTDLGRSLGNVSGGLPFSVVFGREGLPVHRKLGETNYGELARWASGLG
jgi:thiol-disulfide isomerase/thioredoxin